MKWMGWKWVEGRLHEVNVDKYKNLCYSVYIFLLQMFQSQTKQYSWVSITPTVHKLLTHSWKLIGSNDGYGLGSLDESGLEGCNKLLRYVRTCIARKTSQKDNGGHNQMTVAFVRSTYSSGAEESKKCRLCFMIFSCRKWKIEW